MKAFPKISIVTPSYNQGKYLEETILSIINQGYPNLEYIIIDGGSTDDSFEIIKKYEKHLKYWVSESDKGQADAINKGILHCTGDIFNWINSDDLLAPNSLSIIALLYQKDSTIAGKVFNFYEDNAALNDFTQNKNIDFTNFLKLKSTYHQPGIWVKLEAFKEIGLDINNHYYFDFLFYLNYFKKYPSILYTSDILAHFRVHSQSKTTLILDKSESEIINFYKQLNQSEDYRFQRKSIQKVIKYLESVSLIKNWLSLRKEHRLTIDFVKLIFSNFTYLEINFYWKFLIKYLINYKDIKNKNTYK
jgi:glycosyltransferase involved in cell wall biosynthesis